MFKEIYVTGQGTIIIDVEQFMREHSASSVRVDEVTGKIDVLKRGTASSLYYWSTVHEGKPALSKITSSPSNYLPSPPPGQLPEVPPIGAGIPAAERPAARGPWDSDYETYAVTHAPDEPAIPADDYWRTNVTSVASLGRPEGRVFAFSQQGGSY